MEASKDKLNHYLAKYWDADSNLEQEQYIRDARHHLSDEDIQLKTYFGMQLAFQDIHTSPELDKKLMSIADNPVISLKQRFIQYSRTIAASLVLVVCVGFLFQYYVNKKQNQILYADTFDNPEQAWQVLKTAFVTVSDKFDEGNEILTQQLAKIDQLQTIE
jgi:hypothetical protein